MHNVYVRNSHSLDLVQVHRLQNLKWTDVTHRQLDTQVFAALVTLQCTTFTIWSHDISHGCSQLGAWAPEHPQHWCLRCSKVIQKIRTCGPSHIRSISRTGFLHRWHKGAAAHDRTNSLNMRTHTHTHTYRTEPTHRSRATRADVLPHVLNHSFLFSLRAEAEPHRPWCHWWGHCLGHQQHSWWSPESGR